MGKARIEVTPRPGDEDWVVVRVLIDDDDCVGHDATIRIDRVVHVKDKRPVHRRKNLWRETFEVRQREHRFEVARSRLGRGFSYQGQQIEIRLETHLEIDDGVLFDTKVKGMHRLRILDRPEISGKASELAEPADRFNFFANLKAIPPKNRMITLGLTVIGGLVVVFNAILGIHDQFSPEAQTWFYSHTDSEGDGQMPLVNALMGSGAAGAAIWFAIRAQLRKYMDFALASVPDQLTPETRLPAKSLINGRARVALQRITVRVVAYNLEKGQYKRGSGTQERTVSFSTPARAIKLYEKFLPHVPAQVPVQSYLDGDVDFGAMFQALYPPFQLGSSHGLDVQWEIQLLHPEYVDHEVVAGTPNVKYQDFLNG